MGSTRAAAALEDAIALEEAQGRRLDTSATVERAQGLPMTSAVRQAIVAARAHTWCAELGLDDQVDADEVLGQIARAMSELAAARAYLHAPPRTPVRAPRGGTDVAT